MQYKDNELGTGTEMMPAYEEAYTELTKHDLIRYEEQLRTISENCETEFRESFLARMRENLENAKKEVLEISDDLEKVGQEIGVDIRIQLDDIFNNMHRI